MKAFGYLVLIGLFICAWCPWFEEMEAKQLIYNKVRESQSTLQNGCVLTIKPETIEKMPFGYKETVAYNCTLNTDFLTEGENIVFVTFFKEVINVPHPIIK
jgi:hypothetical protein